MHNKKAERGFTEGGGYLARGAEADEPFITALWREAFGDSEEYIKKFLENHRNTEEDPDRIFFWKEQGEYRTMLFALPAKIKRGREIKNARYLYAIATKRAYRGKKYLRRMLPELKKALGEDCVLFLVPETGVIPYYESLGFVLREALPGFVLEAEVCREGQLVAASEKLALEKITDVSYYQRLRDAYLEERDGVLWDTHEILWAICDISMAQGGAYVVKCNRGEYLLAGIRKESAGKSRFQVIETTFSETVLREVGAALLEKLDCTVMKQDKLCYMIEREEASGALYLSLALNG